MRCKKCGNEITGQFCPACGTLQGSRKKKVPLWKVLVGVPVAIIGFAVLIVAFGGNDADAAARHTDVNETPEPAISEADFRTSCEALNYKDLLRNPENYIGKNVLITVKISQVLGGSSGRNKYYRCYSDTSGYGYYYDDEYYIQDDRYDSAPKLLEDDIIAVYGTYEGIETITRAIGWTSEEVPRIVMRYVDLIEE